MDRSTRNKVWGLMGALILCAGSAGLGQDIYLLGDGVAGDPNEPAPPDVNAPWDPATHLTAGWRSMKLSTELCNPAEPELSQIPPVRSLTFTGRIHVVDPNGLIGVSEVAADALAFDEAGKQLAAVRVSHDPPSYKPLRYARTIWAPTGELRISIVPYNFSIDMSMEPNAPFPVALGRLEWSTSVLLSDHFEVVDIPFVPTDDWIELTPGLEILVEKVVVQEGKYSYQMKARYDRNRVSYLDVRDRPPGRPAGREEMLYSWPSQALPEVIVTAMDIVDAKGTSVYDASTGLSTRGYGGSFSDSGDQRTATRDGLGYCSACGAAAFIRHVIAFQPYSRQVRFVLQDVPVPSL
jgi:hypothetical protein